VQFGYITNKLSQNQSFSCMLSENMRHTALTRQENLVICIKQCLLTQRTNDTKLKTQLATVTYTLVSYWISEPSVYSKWQQHWQNHMSQSCLGSTLFQINDKSKRREKQMPKGKYLCIWICPRQPGIHPSWNRFLCWDSARKLQAAQNSHHMPMYQEMTREGKKRWQNKSWWHYTVYNDLHLRPAATSSEGAR